MYRGWEILKIGWVEHIEGEMMSVTTYYNCDF